MAQKKKFWKSKTFWLNIIGAAAIILQSQTDYIISPASQVEILALINLVLRFATKEPVVWK